MEAKWQEIDGDLPEHLCETLEHADPGMYPSVHTALKPLLTMPVSTATPGHTFSALRRTKPWLKNTMTDERLSGLAVLHVHRDHSRCRRHRTEIRWTGRPSTGAALPKLNV